MSKSLERLTQLGFQLPKFNTKGGNYALYKKYGNMIFTAGQVSLRDDVLLYHGTVGVDLDVETAKLAAQVCALNLLAIVHAACDGDLDRVRVMKINGYVKCHPSFEQQATVLNGASDLLISVLGEERGSHARAAVGVAAIPRGAPVEVEGIFVID